MMNFAAPVLLLLLSVAAERSVNLVDVDQKASRGELVRLESGKAVIATGTQTVEYPVERILEIRPTATPEFITSEPRVVVHLLGGTRIVGKDLTTVNQTIEIVRVDGTKLSVAIDAVELVRFSVTPEEAAKDVPADIQKILRTKSAEDRLLVEVEGALDYHDGIIRKIEPETVGFELDGSVLSVSRKKIVGLIFHGIETSKPAVPFCQFVERDGSSWSLTELIYDAPQDLFRWKTVWGLQGTTPFSDWVSADFGKVNTVPLVRLTPISVRSTPPVQWMEKNEQNPLALLDRMAIAIAGKTESTPSDGTSPTIPGVGPPSRLKKTKQLPLTTLEGVMLDGKLHDTGYTILAKTEIVYQLSGEYTTLLGLAGIDDRIRPSGRVKLVFSGDGVLLYETTIRGDHAARPLRVDLNGVKNLTITVDLPDGLDNAARLNLVEMVLVKQSEQ